MALLFPAEHGHEAARRAQAGHDVQNIVAATEAYRAEYGAYPGVGAAAGEDALLGDPTIVSGHPNSALFYTLRAIPAGANAGHALNPKRIPFYEGKQARSQTAPKAGFADSAEAPEKMGSYFDPWGQQYGVIIDANGDGVLDLSRLYLDFPHPVASPKKGVGAFALGKDGQLGKGGDRRFKNESGRKSDDVLSWQ